MVTPEEARIAADRLEAVFEGSLPTVLRDMADTVERLEAQRLQLRKALRLLATAHPQIAAASDEDLNASILRCDDPIGVALAGALLSSRAALRDTT